MTNSDHTEPYSSPLQFPCDFVVKVIGKSNDQFESDILSLVQKHYSDVKPENITKRNSKDKHYTALTIAIHATSQAELDALYQELSDCDNVLMAL